MIVPERRSWWHLVFRYRGTELERTRFRLAAVAVVAVFVTILEERHDWHPNLTPLPFTLVGIALGIFLGFRNNASYDRWWEGRKLWGALVNTSRTFTRQVLTLVGQQPGGERPDERELAELRRKLVYRTIAFAHALRHSLRDERDEAELEKLLSPAEIVQLRAEANRPFALSQGSAELLREAWRRGWIHPQHLAVLEGSLKELTDVQGGCERIKSTPLPFSYTTLIHRITAGYCYALPFGVVDSVGIYTPFVVTIVAYAFFGLDAVGDEIEMPFGRDPNDLALRSICRNIELQLRQRLGEKDLPPPLEPQDEILD
ncbi:MAG: bestrophin [Planctomycetaceae bacterium]|nr:bestrophin [Planctomycetaceae bacterium]